MVYDKIISVAKDVIKNGLIGEINETIAEKCERKYGKKMISKFQRKFASNEMVHLPNEISPKLGLAVSYDMGWQKRGTGNRYDSLSGHSFLIGCRTKKIIGIAMIKKEYFNAKKNNFERH